MKRRAGLLPAIALFLLFAVAAGACGADDSATAAVSSSSAESDTAVEPGASDTAVAAEPDTPTPRPATPTPRATARRGDEKPAPELQELTGWINSDPFSLADQRGKVVLLDFWTYTCVNCIRTLPYLKAWHGKYADQGLVILGVHTPEFEFEKVPENVIDAVSGFGIGYAVAQDNDYGTWRAFDNRYWPAKYLVDADGLVRYTHFGEGAYDETELQIRDLLIEAGADLGGIPASSDPGPELDPKARSAAGSNGLTRELYAGYERNEGALRTRSVPPYILHEEYYQEHNADILYKDPGAHDNHFIYLHGLWRNDAESLLHARQTSDHEDYIAINFYATSVNVVMGAGNGTGLRVRVTIDDAPLALGQAGDDVMFDDEGDSYLLVDEPRMYRLVDLSAFGGHELKLSSNSSDFSLFAFTFGAYEGGEPG